MEDTLKDSSNTAKNPYKQCLQQIDQAIQNSQNITQRVQYCDVNQFEKLDCLIQAKEQLQKSHQNENQDPQTPKAQIKSTPQKGIPPSVSSTNLGLSAIQDNSFNLFYDAMNNELQIVQESDNSPILKDLQLDSNSRVNSQVFTQMDRHQQSNPFERKSFSIQFQLSDFNQENTEETEHFNTEMYFSNQSTKNRQNSPAQFFSQKANQPVEPKSSHTTTSTSKFNSQKIHTITKSSSNVGANGLDQSQRNIKQNTSNNQEDEFQLTFKKQYNPTQDLFVNLEKSQDSQRHPQYQSPYSNKKGSQIFGQKQPPLTYNERYQSKDRNSLQNPSLFTEYFDKYHVIKNSQSLVLNLDPAQKTSVTKIESTKASNNYYNFKNSNKNPVQPSLPLSRSTEYNSNLMSSYRSLDTSIGLYEDSKVRFKKSFVKITSPSKCDRDQKVRSSLGKSISLYEKECLPPTNAKKTELNQFNPVISSGNKKIQKDLLKIHEISSSNKKMKGQHFENTINLKEQEKEKSQFNKQSENSHDQLIEALKLVDFLADQFTEQMTKNKRSSAANEDI